MPKRRKIIIGLGGSIAIAGCTGDTEEEEPEPEPEPELEPEEEDPELEEEIEPPVKEPEDVPQYTVESIDDISFNGTVRYDYDITASGNLPDYSKEDLIRISKELILETISEQDVNALSFAFWRENQEIGAEQAHVVIEWAPNARWGEAEEVDAGDYSLHDFYTINSGYFEAVEIDAPKEVELYEEFTITATIKNLGISTDSIQLMFRNGSTYEGTEIELEPKEQTEIEGPLMTISTFPTIDTEYISVEDSIGSITLGNVGIEITPASFDLNDYYKHPDGDWEMSVTEVDIEDDRVYAKIEGEGFEESWKNPSYLDFSLIRNGDEHDSGIATFRDNSYSSGLLSGWIVFYTGEQASRSEIKIRYMDSHSTTTSDIVVAWKP